MSPNAASNNFWPKAVQRRCPNTPSVASTPLATTPIASSPLSPLASKSKRPASKRVGGQKPSKTPRLVAPSLTTTPTAAIRSKKASDDAKSRDKHVCILTQSADPVAACIFPFSVPKDEAAMNNIHLLLSLWGEEKLEKWWAECENGGVTESPQNRISLNHQMHHWWGKGRFGLKPISSSDQSVLVQFHWMKKSAFSPNSAAGHDKSEAMARLCTENPDMARWGPKEVAHRYSGLPLESGQMFEIFASNPQDLPSMELLEIQWCLLRIAAMSGAGEKEDEDLDDDTPVVASFTMSSTLAKRTWI